MEDRIKETIARTCPHRARDAQISKIQRKGRKRRLAIEQLGEDSGVRCLSMLYGFIHLLVIYKVLLFLESDGLVLSYKLKLS